MYEVRIKLGKVYHYVEEYVRIGRYGNINENWRGRFYP